MAAYTLTVTSEVVPIAPQVVKFRTSIGKLLWLKLSWWRGLGRGVLRTSWR